MGQFRGERSVARPDNPWGHGSPSIVSFLAKRRVIDDAQVDPLRLLENKNARSAIEIAPLLVAEPPNDARYHVNITARSARELAITPMLMKGLVPTEDWLKPWVMHPAFELLERSTWEKSFAIDQVPDENRPGKERWGNRELEQFLDTLGVEKTMFPESGITPDRLEESFDDKKPFYRDSGLGYIPACIDDGRFSAARSIHLTDGNITMIENITTRGFPLLESISLDNNKISSLEGFDPGLPVSHVYADHNQITSLEGIEKLKDLVSIYAINNNIHDLNNATSQSLRFLDVDDNAIEEIPDLSARFPNLFHVAIQSNKIREVPSADFFPESIYEIDLAGNYLPKSACDAFQRDLMAKGSNASVYCDFID